MLHVRVVALGCCGEKTLCFFKAAFPVGCIAEVIGQFGVVRIIHLGPEEMFSGPGIVFLFIRLHPFLSRGGKGIGPGRARHCGEQCKKKQKGKEGIFGTQNEQIRQEGGHGQAKEPGIAVDGGFFLASAYGGCLHGPPDFLIINSIQVHISGDGLHIGAAGQGRNLAQGLFVQFGKENGSVFVFNKACIPSGDGCSLRIADTDAENFDMFVRCFFGRSQRITQGFFAVRDQDNGLFRGFLGIKGLYGRFNGRVQICAAYGHGIRGECLQKKPESRIVQGDRALEKGGSGKGDQTDLVPLEHVQKIADFPLGPFQAVGLDIFGQHAPGTVQGQNDAHPFAFDAFPGVAVLKAGQGDDDAYKADEEQSVFAPCLEAAGTDADGLQGMGIAVVGHDAGAPFVAVDNEEHTYRHQPDKVEDLRVDECHDTRR